MSGDDAGPAGETEKVSRPGEYRGYSDKLYAGFEISSVYVEARDGTKLAVDLYRPTDSAGKVVETPLPVLWMHTPYNRRTPSGKAMAETYPGTAAALVPYGYVVAIVDFRGLYASYGQNAGYNRGEWLDAAHLDAYDVTEWLAKQPFSTGKIGMWGCSATGGSQLQAATTAPPSLKAVFPMSCEFDAYPFAVPGGMSPAQGASSTPTNTTPAADMRDMISAPVDADTDGSQLQAAFASHGEPLDNLGYLPFSDSIAAKPPVQWWQLSSPHTYLPQINASGTAFYLAANWDEATTKYGAFFTLNNLTRPAKLLVGPAAHCAWSTVQEGTGPFVTTVQTLTGFDLTTEELRFFDFWLKDIPNGIADEPKVFYYTYGAPKGKEWSTATAWPLPNENRVPYYLHERTLGTDAQPDDSAKDDFVVSYAANATNAADNGLVYETPALEKPMQLTGHPVVDLWLASTANDADVVAYLQNVAPDGTFTSYSMHGRLRASLRKEEPAPYNNLGLPWHPFREGDVQPLVPGEPVELRFDILPFSMVFEAGHKLRLVLTFADVVTPQLTPPPTVSVYRDKTHPSTLTLPIIAQ